MRRGRCRSGHCDANFCSKDQPAAVGVSFCGEGCGAATFVPHERPRVLRSSPRKQAAAASFMRSEQRSPLPAQLTRSPWHETGSECFSIRRCSLDLMFQALADPGRRVMVERLTRGPASVSELAEPLTMSLPRSCSTCRCWRRADWCAPRRSAACAPAASSRGPEDGRALDHRAAHDLGAPARPARRIPGGTKQSKGRDRS